MIRSIHSGENIKDPYFRSMRSVFDRLMNIVRKRYGCEMNYIAFGERDDHKILRELLFKNEPVSLNQLHYFPVYLKGELVGAAQISRSPNLSATDLSQLHNIISLVIESTLLSANSLDEILRLERNLDISHGSENIVSIDRERRRRSEMSEPEAGPEPRPPFKRYGFTIPCFIEGKNHFDMYRMASEIHYHSNRFAFVSFDDLDEITREDAVELRKLGPVTVFIEELAELSEREEACLVEFLEGTRDQNSPQIISGSVFSHKELSQRKGTRKDLLNRLQSAYLKMTQPFEDYLKYGVVEFFYDSITRPDAEA